MDNIINSIFELDLHDFEDSKVKNKLIRSSTGGWIGFVDKSVTDKEEIRQILQEAPFLTEYDMVVFGADCPDGEVGLLDMLGCPQTTVYAFFFRRELLIKTGSFNELLLGNANYEFILRAMEKGNVYAISCNAEKEYVFDSFTMAYVVRKYIVFLSETEKLDEVFLYVQQVAETVGELTKFNQMVDLFMESENEYIRIEANTAPFLVLMGDDTCIGVLIGFAHSLADELVALGQAVVTTDGRYGDFSEMSIEWLMTQNFKAIVGFQTYAFGKEKFKRIKGKKVQFWFDPPVFFDDFFTQMDKKTYLLCQDADYAEYLYKYCGFKNAIQFPPGGTVIENLPKEKIFDISFVGTYVPLPEEEYEDEFRVGFLDYMVEHPDDSLERGMLGYGKTLGLSYSKEEVMQNLQRVKLECHYVTARERHYTIEKIVGNGVQLHVFGDSWSRYQGAGRENLIIHPLLMGEEPYRVWAQSKIGLNIMHGHRAGMTERIANIMLCGTCCLSDETVYLREYFKDGEDVVLYKRTALDELPNIIRYLLEHDEERENIAAKGYEMALAGHTWRVRAEQLLELLNT